MAIKQHYEDSIYNAGATAEVFQGKPSVEIGSEGDEKWCWVDGEGLFLAKKYNGEWRFFTSSTELLEAGVISGDSSSAGGGSTTAQTGQFSDLTVTNSSSLQTSTGISGTLSVTATTLTAFPHTDNLKLTSQELDTIQPIKIASAPQFNELGLGVVPSGEVGNIELTSILGVSAVTFINSALKVGKINYTNTSGTSLADGLGLEDLTQGEATQLKNIDSATISSTQWGYVGGMDQHVATASDVVFEKLSLTETSKTWSFDPIGSSGTNTLSGDLQITTANTEDASIIIGGSNYDDHTVRSYAYTSGMFTGDGWSIYEDNNKHNMEVDNLSVRGTLSVYELLIQQIRATNGSVFITSACKLLKDGDSLYHVNVANTYTLTFETDEDDNKPHPFANGDLILARRCDISGDTTDIVSEIRFTVTDITVGNASQLSCTLEYASMGTGAGDGQIPTANFTGSDVLNGMDFVRIGNTTDANRQGGIYLTSDDTLAPFIDIFDEVSSWQEWDGITNIFGLADGSFDLATTGTYYGDQTPITGSSWYSYSPDSNGEDGKVSIVSSGGVSNQKYCKLDTDDNNTVYIYQPITFPNVSSGDYKVTIEWYGKQGEDFANEPRIMVRDVAVGVHTMSFTTAGILDTVDPPGFIDWDTITSPENQRTASIVWHKYQWELTVPYTMFSGDDDKVMYLIFATAPTTAPANAWIDDVKIDMQGKVKTRIGRLEGVGKSGYGLWGENVYLKGRIEAQEGYIGNEFAGWRIDSTGITNEGTQSYISAGQTTVGLDGGGSYLSGLGDLSLGNSGTAGLKWVDATNTLTVRGTIHVDSTGSVDASAVPSFGQNLKIAAVGKGGSAASVGVFKADSNGEIVSQISGSPSLSTASGTLMVFDSSTNLLDTTFNSTGVKHYTDGDTMSTAIDGLDNGTSIGVALHYNAYLWINSESSYGISSDLISSLKKCGGSNFTMDSTSVFCSYILIGTKKASSHTKGTELISYQGDDTSNPHYTSITANFKDNIIDILDWDGSLADFDAESPKSFKFSNASGFNFRKSTLDETSQYIPNGFWRSLISFPMPYVKSEDTSNLQLFFTSKNLTDEGVGTVRLYLNATHISNVSDADLQDADGTSEFIHQIDSIPSNLFKVDPGEVNVFQLRSQSNGTDTDTQYIYDFELRDSTTGAIYSSGAVVSPEGNLVENAGFENITGTNNIPNWSEENRGGGTGYVADTTIKMTGMQSLKHTSGSSPSYQSYVYQTFPFKTNTFYTLRFNFRWEDNWTGSTSNSGDLGELPKFSIVAPDIDGSNTIASFDIDTDDGTVTWYNSKKWNPFSLIGSIANSATGSWQTFEYQFKIPANAPVGSGNTAINNPTDFQVWIYTGKQANQTVWLDAVQFFEHDNLDLSVTPEETGLYLTGERLGYYNGSGGLYGWSSVIKNDGSFFFGSPHEQANLLSPGSGGPYIRFTGETLEVNANMVAGIIQSENLTATTGTRISLADGSMTTKGTNTDSGLVLDSAGNLELNGATLDGGTISGVLFISDYAQGGTVFVTEWIGASASSQQAVEVNGIWYLKCDRVVESAACNFGSAPTSETTKNLNIYHYDSSSVNSLSRTAESDANTKINVMGAAPFFIYTAFDDNANSTGREKVKFTFTMGTTVDTVRFAARTYINPQGTLQPDAGDFEIGWTNNGSYSNTNVLSQLSSNDFSIAGSSSLTLTCGAILTLVYQSQYEDSGDIIGSSIFLYMGGVIDGINSGTLSIKVHREGSGSYTTGRTVNFSEGFFKVFN